MTTTGEIYQPVRVHYVVSNFRRVIKTFNRLQCVDFDPAQDRWVWLYTAEAKKIKFKKKADEGPVVLGSFLKKGPNEVVLDVRSFERAVEGIVFFDRHIPRKAARVTDVSVVNRLFDVQEGNSSTFDHFFDSETVVRNDPEKTLQEIEQIGSTAQDEDVKRASIFAHMEEKLREPLPEIERFPVHFYEDGIASVDLALRSRQVIAMQHWSGNTRYTYADYIQELIKGSALDKEVSLDIRRSTLARLTAPVAKVFLVLLEKTFDIVRKKSIPPFPYDRTTDTIHLPADIEEELLRLISTGNKVEALKRVLRLTGAGLRVSKDYVDHLAESKGKCR